MSHRCFATALTFTVQAAAHGASAGFMWLVNQPANTKYAEVKAIQFRSQLASALLVASCPRIDVSRGSTSTAATGATASAASCLTNGPNADLTVRTANTGLTQTINASLTQFFPIASATAVSYAPPISELWLPPAPFVLAPGEFVIVRQTDAGTASDDRRIQVEIHWREYDSPSGAGWLKG